MPKRNKMFYKDENGNQCFDIGVYQDNLDTIAKLAKDTIEMLYSHAKLNNSMVKQEHEQVQEALRLLT